MNPNEASDRPEVEAKLWLNMNLKASARVLTHRGTEYCGNPQHREYELYLALEDIDHTRTRAKSPQTNGINERLHKTMLNVFYRIVFRKKISRSRPKDPERRSRGCAMPSLSAHSSAVPSTPMKGPPDR